MYGSEYLDWVAREEAASKLDAFLASFEPEDRRWVLSVMRDRHREVIYRDRPQFAQGDHFGFGQQSGLAAAVQRQQEQARQVGGGSILSLLGRPFI